MKKIDFFIVGAQKAGTTSVFEYLKAQSSIIQMPMVKEVMEFSEIGNNLKHIQSKISSYYEDHLQTNKVIGLADVRSLFLHEVASKNIFDYNPDAKILIILREPVDRAISSFKFSIKNQVENISNFEEIYNVVEKQRIAKFDKNKQLALTYLNVSKYYEQICSYQNLFPSENILFLVFEDIVSAPVTQLEKIFEFLGIDKSYILNNDVFEQTFNQGGSVKSKTIAKIFNRKNILRSLYGSMPLKFRMKIRKTVINPFLEMNKTNQKTELDIPEKLILKIRGDFENEINKLESITHLQLKEKWGYLK